jgi:hypothetical protein
MKCVSLAVLAGALLCAAVPQDPPRKGRYESFTEKAAQGPKLKLVAATYFGGEGLEEFTAARTLPDGTIVAFGNAWGPEFHGSPLVLGKGEHRKLKAVATDAKGKTSFPMENPDIAGMAVLYSPDLRSVKKVLRFDWGVASLSAAAVTEDGKGLILAGRSTAAFRTLSKNLHTRPEPPAPEVPAGKKPPPKDAGTYEYEGVSLPGDVFVARVSPEGAVDWAWVFEGYRHPPGELWVDHAGNVYADLRGMTQIAADGSAARVVVTETGGRQAKFLAVDPADGSCFYGGDRNTNTGKEPWRQPYLYKFDLKGEKLWKLWEWPSKSLRDGVTPGVQGEVADSSARAMDVGPNGELLVGCWSDGGNSLFFKQPTDATKKVPEAPFHMDCSGMKGANSLAHILRIDGKTLEANLHALWMAYFPSNVEDARKRGSPNGARIRQIKALPGGGVAVAGSAASVLVQTPGAFYAYPGDGRGYGGECVVVFDADFSHLLFSSYLPGCENVSLWPTSKGVVVVSRSRGDDGAKEPTKSPVLNALQGEKKGDVDAHILLLELP